MKRRPKFLGPVIGLLFCLLAGGILTACAFSSAGQPAQTEPAAITVESLPEVSSEAAKEIRQAAEASARFLQEETGIRLERPVRIVLTPDRKTYVAETMKRFRLSEIEAERATRGTHALSGGNLIIADISGIPSARQKTFLLAHELTHKFQRQIAGSQAGKVMWLLEGLADAEGVQAAAKQGYWRVDQYKANWQAGLMTMKSRPGLQELTSGEDWSKAMSAYGSAAVYKTAGLAVLILMDRYGQEKVWNYFAEIGQGKEPEAVFQQVFGLSFAEFTASFEQKIRLAS